MNNFRRFFSVLGFVATAAAATNAGAEERSVSREQMESDARAYYASEMTTGFLFMGFGAVTAGAGGVTLTQSGDFSRGLGLSSLVLGSVTVVGGAAYVVAVKMRGDYYATLAGSNPHAYKLEESDRLEGTHARFPLYLGTEIVEALAGMGMAAYGLAAKNDLWKGFGVGTAIQGIGNFVIDMPGAGRAERYRDEVNHFRPEVGVSLGGNGRPWGATIGQKF